MQKSDILKEIFDKNIIEVIKVFASSQKQHFSLSQVAYLSGVKTATSLRIIHKLIEKDFVDINVMGKTKYYQWKKGSRTEFLVKLLQSTAPETLEI
ncbi:MAG: hypothetical protein ABH864_03835 [archaeon]